MRIGIDLDEVVANTMEAIVGFHNEKYKTQLVKNDFHSYQFWEVWGGTREEAIQKMYTFFGTDHSAGICPIPGSLEAIQKLKGDGHELFVITGRHTEISEETRKWIERHCKNVFSGIHFANSYSVTGEHVKKSAICNKLDIKIMVEDDIHHVHDLAGSGIKVFLFDQPWNQKGVKIEENIERVYSWGEIIEKIEDC